MRRPSRRARALIAAALGIAAAVSLACAGARGRIAAEADGRVFEVGSAPSAPVAIVPGAGVRLDGGLSSVLEDRLAVAVDLYKAGKVSKLLLSGDHGTVHYDEPFAMGTYCERAGVSPADIFLDHAGFDTYSTLYRARHVFRVERALVVSQDFHLPRALFLARRLGIDAQGVRADRRAYARRLYYGLREIGASVKAVVQADVTHPRPRFLGPELPIGGDGRATRDAKWRS